MAACLEIALEAWYIKRNVINGNNGDTKRKSGDTHVVRIIRAREQCPESHKERSDDI